MTGILAALICGDGGGAELPGGGIAVIDTSVTPTNSQAVFTIEAAGTYVSVGSVQDPSGTWKLFGAGSDYEVNFITSDSPTGDAVNTWLGLGSDRGWAVTDSVAGGGSVTASGTLSIRRASSGTVVASCALSLSATEDI